jgi:hypothetical protein
VEYYCEGVTDDIEPYCILVRPGCGTPEDLSTALRNIEAAAVVVDESKSARQPVEADVHGSRDAVLAEQHSAAG